MLIFFYFIELITTNGNPVEEVVSYDFDSTRRKRSIDPAGLTLSKLARLTKELIQLARSLIMK